MLYCPQGVCYSALYVNLPSGKPVELEVTVGPTESIIGPLNLGFLQHKPQRLVIFKFLHGPRRS